MAGCLGQLGLSQSAQRGGKMGGEGKLTCMVQESDGGRGEAAGEWSSPWDSRQLRAAWLSPELHWLLN